VTRRGLQDRVLLVGRFPLERMPSFMRHASALLVSLRADPVFALTIPGKLQTYLQAAIPILAMIDGEGARVVEESGAGLACPAGDANGLAHSILSLAALTEAERTAMGRRGADYAAREFDRGELISRLEAALFETATTAVSEIQTPAAEARTDEGRERT
jgi:colanic acid biosynthesis glycosyl transferase WcaI